MKLYLVGGAVRDLMLFRSPKDYDYVIIGGTEQDAIDMGLVKIEAQSFPVFKDPIHGSEYALGRREKKTGPGYHGFEIDFSPDVTLEEDLSRRDLTINSMAMEVYQVTPEGWPEFVDDTVIDPFGGMRDIRDEFIRHTSDAFLEDPVRALRACRMAARYGFAIHQSTADLIIEMRDSGELSSLTPERVWLELSKAIMDDSPLSFFTCMQYLGLDFVINGVFHNNALLTRGDITNLDIAQRFAWLHVYDARMSDEITAAYEQLKAPTRVIETIRRTRETHAAMLPIARDFDARQVVRIMNMNKTTHGLFELITVLQVISQLSFDMHELSDKIIRCAQATASVGFADLSDHQAKTLRWSLIADAIDEKKIEIIAGLFN